MMDDYKQCEDHEIALKSFFLGPQAENADALKELIDLFFKEWIDWRRRLYPQDGQAISAKDQENKVYLKNQKRLKARLKELTRRYESEVPKFSPRYVGHMFSEISTPAFLGHLVSLAHNPNNICSDSSRVGLQIEREAIEALAQMLNFKPNQALGHFTSGGTLANFEAIHRARHRLDLWLSQAASQGMKRESTQNLFQAAHQGWETYESRKSERAQGHPKEFFSVLSSNPFEASRRLSEVFDHPYRGPVALIPQTKHYSWTKGIPLFGFSKEAIWPIKLDQFGRLDLSDLAKQVERAEKEQRPILMVVSVAGTTELGEVDRVDEVQDFLDRLEIEKGLSLWHHVDAAYGGLFCSVGEGLSDSLKKPLQAIRRANSVTLDPHKLGYIPFSCGSILCRDSREYFVGETTAPYVFNPGCAEPGLYSIEGSRAATGATATWLSAMSLGFHSEGLGKILRRTLEAKALTESLLKEKGEPYRVCPDTDTNILCLNFAYSGDELSKVNKRTQKILERLHQTDRIFVSKTILSRENYGAYIEHFVNSWGGRLDEDRLFLIRMSLMNPFFTTKETNVFYPEHLVETLEDVLKGL